MHRRTGVARLLRTVSIIVLLVMVVLTPGCHDQREVEEIAFILALGVDQAQNGELDVTFQVAVPTAAESGNIPVLVVTKHAKSIAAAMQELATTMNHVPSFNQLRLIVFGEPLARAGVGSDVDFLLRAREIRLLAWVIVTPGLAGDVLRIKSSTEAIAANMISGMQREAANTAFAPQSTLLEFVDYIGGGARDPLASRISPLKAEGENPDGVATGATPLTLDGAAVFRSDRLVGWLDRSETRGYLWLHGKVANTLISYQDAQSGITGTFRVLANTAKWAVVIDPTDPRRARFTITIRVDGQVNELTGGAAVESGGNSGPLEMALAALIREEALAAVRKSQAELHADFIGLGERLRTKYSVANWSQISPYWIDQYLPAATVNVAVSFKLRRPGMTVSELVPDAPR